MFTSAYILLAIDFAHTLQAAYGLFSHSLFGTGLMLIGGGIGWQIGRYERSPLAILLGWWLDGVVHQIIQADSFWVRSLGIALNNSMVCLVIVACGMVVHLPWFVLLVMGVNLGLAVRLLGERTSEDESEEPFKSTKALPGGTDAVDEAGTDSFNGEGQVESTEYQRVTGRQVFLGVLLNMLEVPAIMLSAGLSLAQGTLWPVASLPVWSIFGAVVVPALILAAVGESLWMRFISVPDWKKAR